MNVYFTKKITCIAILCMGSTSIFASNYSSKSLAPLMVSIPAGKFIMGCINNAPCPPEEKPKTSITIHPFTISKYEITFSQWDQCYNDKGCDHYPDDNNWGRGNRPVINVNWNDTQQYLIWLSKKEGKTFRLASEAEWEYAARAGTTTATPYGNCIQPSHANFDSRFGYTAFKCQHKPAYKGQTTPVGSYPENRYGLNDMIGNISEWTLSCSTKNYSPSPSNKNCKYSITRGGSWESLRWDARSAVRISTPINERNNTTGFRIVYSEKTIY